MNQKGCSGKCIAGIIIAIIFGALFLWTLVDGIGLQWRVGTYSALAEYLLALVFLAIAKSAKWWAMSCGHSMPGMGGAHCCCGMPGCMGCHDEKPKAKKKR